METDLFGTSERERAVDALHAQTAIYTTDPVVEQLLDEVAWPEGGGKLVDTSAGDGAFLGAALKRLLALRPGASAQEVLERLEGWEIHSHAAAQARGRVASILEDEGWHGRSAREVAAQLVREGDFLTECAEGKRYGTIVGNPPYLRWVYVPELLRNEYEMALPDHATQDMLHAFLDRCAARLQEGGEIAFVTSDRWLSNENASRLREALGKTLGIASLQRLDSSSAFYRPKHRRKGSPPRVHPVAVVLRERDRCSISLDKGAVFDGEDDEVDVRARLSDVATVTLAPWLGTAGVFVVDEVTAKRMPVSALVPAMDTDDVKGGVMSAPKRFAILTRPGQEPDSEVRSHLLRTMGMMCERGRRSDWLPPERFDAMDLGSERLVVPRISKTLKPIRVPAGVLPINHNLSIVCKGSMGLDELEQHLQSSEAQRWMERRAARLENGYFSITTRLLRKLPVCV